MGKAKEEMIARQHEAAVAQALGITPEDLAGFEYEVLEDTNRQGNVIRTYVEWADDIPDGVDVDIDGIPQTTIVFPDEADKPDDD